MFAKVNHQPVSEILDEEDTWMKNYEWRPLDEADIPVDDDQIINWV